jgi:hypothetical protein
MKPFIRACIASAALVAAPAFALGQTACEDSGDARVMRARIASIERDLERIEVSAVADERRSLTDINMKRLREATGQLRHRDLTPECRAELTSTLLNALVRNELAARDGGLE